MNQLFNEVRRPVQALDRWRLDETNNGGRCSDSAIGRGRNGVGRRQHQDRAIVILEQALMLRGVVRRAMCL
ncbi:MAG: hypothetical protein ABL993_03665 [Vicinamibacterales bacterium]